MEGQRVAKDEGGKKNQKKLPWIIAGSVVAVAAAAYLGLCAWANSQETILPNVNVAGIDVSNMTVEQAREKVEAAVGEAGPDIELTLTYEGVTQSLNASELSVDVTQSVQDAWEIGHGNFFTAGPRMLSHMLGVSEQVPLALAEENTPLEDFVSDMEEAVSSREENHAYEIQGDRLVMTKGAPIAAVDWEQVKADVRESFQDAFVERLAGEGGPVERELTLTAATQAEGEDPDFDAIYQELHAEPVDASLDLESMEITDHVVGVDFDVQALKKAYQEAKGGETFSIPVTLTQPKPSPTATLRKFPAIS